MSRLTVKRLHSQHKTFSAELTRLTQWSAVADESLETTVKSIIEDVRLRGDDCLIELTKKFDKFDVAKIADLQVNAMALQRALVTIPAEVREALELSAQRIRAFHEHQKEQSWQFTDDSGAVLGQQITPLERVGIYVPGGKASYPSSVLMNAIPASVAGVEEIVMVVPAPNGELNKVVLAAAAIAGVERVHMVGGAQAIAALAYGTQTIPKVDKIVGPGNRYVACAKKMVFGEVGLDMVAGPSEILIVCDGKTNPDWIAMDLFSQAEHDEVAQSILISPDANFLDAVQESIDKLLPTLTRRDIIAQSLQNRGAMIQVETLHEAVELVNQIAPEHLEMSVENAQQYLPKIRHAGAIFLGRHTPEAFGDYCAGPNHVLPTSTTARFASPLGVYDFQKRSSIIQCSPESAQEIGGLASTLARSESLTAHALSAEYRLKK